MSRNDVFSKMGINNEIRRLNLLELKDGIRMFEPSYSDQAAYNIVKYLLQEEETISLGNLAVQLECEDNEDVETEISSTNNVSFDKAYILFRDMTIISSNE